MADKLNEKLSGHQSELSYAGPGRSKKGLQRAYHKAHRGPAARSEIESQLADLEPLDIDTIGDLVPIGRGEWEALDGTPGPEGVLSEKEAYLIDLAWDIASRRVDMDDDKLDKLIDLAPPEFEIQLTYAYDEQRTQEDMDDAFGVYDTENDPEHSWQAREVEKRLSENLIGEDHERELREAIRLIFQEKILPEAGWRRNRRWRDPGGQGVSAGQSYYSGKSIARQSAMNAVEKAKEILRKGGWKSKGWGLSNRGLEWTGPAASLMIISDSELQSLFGELSSIEKSIPNSYGQRGPMRRFKPYSETGYIGFNVTMPGDDNPYKFKWSGGKMYGELWGPNVGAGMSQLEGFGDSATGFLNLVKDRVANLTGGDPNGLDPDGDADDALELLNIAADIESGKLSESRWLKLAGLLKG